MMHTRSCTAALLLFTLVGAFSGFAQAGYSFLDAADKLYEGGKFSEAFDLISSNAPETSSDAAMKSAASSALTEMGISEYGVKNYKNAYECFRKALKLSPTNAVATQYYVKMKKEMNVAALKNEEDAKRAAADAAAVTATTSSGGGVQPGIAGPAQGGASAAAAAPAVSNEELKLLMAQLQTAQEKLSSVESTATTAKSESAALKAQLESQRALTQQTLQVLGRIAEKQNAPETPPQVVIQPDPALRELAASFEDQKRLLSDKSSTDIFIIAATAVLGALLLLLIALFLFGLFRSKRRRSGADDTARDSHLQASFTPPGGSYLATAPRPLLEFSAADTSGSLTTSDGELRKALLRAERLSRMYEEAKTGNLSWDTVRKYNDELDTSLKSEILKLAETKISEGDLVSNEAVLPVIFPFLTDYDEYIRDKAQKIAQVALLQEDAGKKDQGAASSDPFDVRMLMEIPEQLKIVLKGRDQSVITAKLSRSIAKRLGLSVADCQLVYKAALAHDAGYLMLDSDELQKILSKPDITEEEFELVKSHVVKGPSYFGDAQVPAEIRDAMLYHHERNDGSGYPDGLKREQIPLFARIIGAAESFAALICHRPHRDRMSASHAMAIIRDARFKFDREIIEALGSVVQTSGSYQK